MPPTVETLSVETPLTEGVANVYLLAEEPVTLVDTGINTEAAYDDLRAELQRAGFAPEDVARVVLTHNHADHGGLAGRIQAVSDATVYAHVADADRVDPTESEWLDIAGAQYEQLRAWDVPVSAIDALRPVQDENHRYHSDPVDVTPLTDGDRLSIGATHLEVIHTPGHTVGSVCYGLTEYGVFTGDTLLPVYTPNIGGADMRLEDPITDYLQSLGRLATLDPTIAYPGHRHRIEAPAERAREISRHHYRQARTLVQSLADRGASAVWPLTTDLYETVEGIHIVLGVGETHAHLRHLTNMDLVLRDGPTFELATDRATVEQRLRAGWPLEF